MSIIKAIGDAPGANGNRVATCIGIMNALKRDKSSALPLKLISIELISNCLHAYNWGFNFSNVKCNLLSALT
jgi:hypothetical protein